MAKMFNSPGLKEQRRLLRNNATRAEQLLWRRLKQSRLQGLKFRRQYSIGQYIVDFYLPSHRLAIEIDGSTHLQIAQKAKDKERTKLITGRGVRVIRFTNADVYIRMDAVLQMIVDFVFPAK